MSSAPQLLPKVPNEHGDDQGSSQKPERSRRTGKLTKIACFECRKRKCKCDGAHPICGPCKQRKVRCDFDSVSGSANTEGLKTRIRSLESELKDVRHKNVSFQEQNDSLRDEVFRLNEEADRAPGQDPWDMATSTDESILADNHAAQQLRHDLNLDTQTDRDARALYVWRMQQRTDTRSSSTDDANLALEQFLNGRRQILSEGQSPTQNGNDVLPALDVSSLFSSDNVPDELSWWALKLPLANPDMSTFARLADAYVTYHQLLWLILPTQNTSEMMPSFIARSHLNELCIPHPVNNIITNDEDLKAPKCHVTDTPPAQTPPGFAPMLLSGLIQDWDRPLSDATAMDPMTGEMRLTAAFEEYVRDENHWTIQPDSGRDRLGSLVSAQGVLDE